MIELLTFALCIGLILSEKDGDPILKYYQLFKDSRCNY